MVTLKMMAPYLGRYVRLQLNDGTVKCGTLDEIASGAFILDDGYERVNQSDVQAAFNVAGQQILEDN